MQVMRHGLFIMQKETRTRLIWILSSLGLLAAISIFLVANIYKSNPRNPLSAIPEQAKVIVLIRGAHFFQQQHIVSSSAYGALKSWPRLTGALDALAHLDSLSRHQDERFHGLKDTRLALAAIPMNDEIHLLFAGDAVSGFSEKRWRQALDTWGTLTPVPQNNMQVWERDGQKIYVQFSHKLILIGSAPLPISMAKETLNKPFRSDFLDHALAVAGSKVGATLFITDQTLESLLLLPFPSFSNIRDMRITSPAWLSFDITFKEDDVMLTSYLGVPQGNKNWLQWFASQAGEASLPDNIPLDSRAFICMSQLFPIVEQAMTDSIAPALQEIDTLPDPSWRLSMFTLPLLNGAWTEAMHLQMPPEFSPTRDTVNQGLVLSGKPDFPAVILNQPYVFEPPDLYLSPDSSFPSALGFRMQAGPRITRAAWLPRYLLHLPDKAGTWGRIDLDPSLPWSASITGSKPNAQGQTRAITSIDWAIRGGQSPFITLHLPGSQTTASQQTSQSNATTEAPIAFSPLPVWDHIKKAFNLLVFDIAAKTYLFSQEGTRLWTRQLDELPTGPPIAVDLLKNGKIQYVFNTTTQIHALDLNGNEVNGYPVRLPSKATNAINIVDYDNNRDYRFLLALENNSIINLSRDGKKVKGWSPPAMSHRITAPVQHQDIGGKDFLIIADTAGEVKMSGRRGETRIEIRRAFKNNPDSRIYLVSNGKQRQMVTTDRRANLQFIQASGKTSTLMLEDTLLPHHFLVGEFSGKGKEDIILVIGGWLKVFNTNGDKLFETRLTHHPEAEPVLLEAGKKRLLALANAANGTLSFWEFGYANAILSLPGALKPIYMDLDKDGRPELVTALGNEVLIHYLE